MEKDNFIVWLKDDFQPNKLLIPDIEKNLVYEHIYEYEFDSLENYHDTQKQIQSLYTPKEVDLGNIFQQEIHNNYIAPSSIRWVSETAGYGLYSESNLGIGQFVGRYLGVIKKNNSYLTFSDYSYKYPTKDSIDRNFIIEAKEKGNITRFINHSFRPNLKPVYAYSQGLYHLIFITIKPIRIGEQFSYNYGQTYWLVRGQPEKIE